MMPTRLLLFLTLLALAGCSASTPRNTDDICALFSEQRSWYKAAREASERWGAPLHVPMAIIYQESHFRAAARPPMRYFLGFIPLGRGSSAYGYAQAQTPVWNDYQRETGHGWSDRDDFSDSIDFVQWYIDKSYRVNGIAKSDAYRQYLNYHEGWGGYRRGSYHSKAWLGPVARKVEARAARYGAQYAGCRDELERGWLRRLFSSTERPDDDATTVEDHVGVAVDDIAAGGILTVAAKDELVRSHCRQRDLAVGINGGRVAAGHHQAIEDLCQLTNTGQDVEAIRPEWWLSRL